MNTMVDQEALVDEFKSVYSALTKDSDFNGLLSSIYTEDLLFTDCFHEVSGLNEFTDYCRSLYKNVTSCRFDFFEEFVKHDEAIVSWRLNYKSRWLKGGKEIKVDGVSHIKYRKEDKLQDETERLKIFFHKDYFDGGAMLYEHLPFIGLSIRQIKKRVG